MRCPKCQYISFDAGDRCRNCGYEFSLAPEEPSPELPIQTGAEPLGPLSDFSLNSVKGAPRPITGSFELPLFKPRDDDAPLVTPSAVPRPPLAVRRATPPIARQRAPRREAVDEPRLALENGEPLVAPAIAAVQDRPVSHESADALPVAPWGARIGAALVDALLTLAIDGTVLYFTLKLCELRLAQAAALPLVPFVAFVLLLNGGYFASFVAAGGQTIGKMATGIRVVPTNAGRDEVDAQVPLGQAVVRAAAYLVSAAPAGLGFVAAFFSRGRRALHDRLADTRVVKA
jgi:uncharacterized RDD family membrane protein YckC